MAQKKYSSNRPGQRPGSKTAQRARQGQRRAGIARLWPFALLGLAVIAAAVLLLTRQDAQTEEPTASAGILPKEISVAEAFEKRSAGAFMLDVREPEEWNEYHIPGVTLIPLGELEARANEVPAGQEVVVVCRSGNRSADGRDILLAAGYDSVTSMAGGMKAWQAAGYPTATGP